MNDQRSVTDQLNDLEKLAAKHGLYDAQDWLRRARASAVLLQYMHRLQNKDLP